jgi:ABC-type dipeptide/oligopeptide/nickel transport system ATPase component
MAEKKISLFEVAYKNLLRKKTRSALTVLGIALAGWVLVSLFGFNSGYEKSLNKDIDNLGFQMLVVAKGCPYEAATLMLKGGTGLKYMKSEIAGDVAREPEVDGVTPMLMQVVFDPNKGESGGLAAFLGVDPLTYPKLKSALPFKAGAWFKDPEAHEAVFGYEVAELEQREVGDKYLIPEKNIEVTVVGILSRTGTQDDGTIFLPLAAVQKIFGVKDVLTAIGIKVKKDVDMTKFEDKMFKLPDVQVVSLTQVKTTIMTLVSTARVMVFSIALLIAMMGVVNTILMSVIERRRGDPGRRRRLPDGRERLVPVHRRTLGLLGIDHRKDHLPGQLSGGEMQRVAIARALVNRPQILLADEPTGNLDTKRSEEIGTILKDLNERTGLTVVLVTHNLPLARMAQRTIELRDGRVYAA